MSLTDNWKAGKLKQDWYFVKFADVIYPDYYNGYFIQTGDKDGIEDLASCDYGELQRLKDLLKECREIWIEYHLNDASKSDAVDIITRINAVIGESEK